MTEVTLIIPNWNGRAHLEACLDSVAAQSRQPASTILVDNGSTDDSVLFVRGRYPWVTVLTLGTNLGFAVAVNRGIVATDTPYFALLNNDTKLDVFWLDALVRRLSETPRAGMAACKMLNFYEPGEIDGAGDTLTRSGAPFTRGSGEPDDGRYGKAEFLFGACAGAALYRRELVRDIGMLDEDFVSYYEDADFSYRAQLAGWKCLYVPEAICFHKRGATANTIPHYPTRMQERNLTALYVKNYPAGALLRKGPLIVAARIRRLYRSARAGAGRPAIDGFIAGVLLIPAMLRKRRSVQKHRRIAVSDFLRLIEGKA